MVARLLPTFCTSILYYTVYSQMGSVFVEQARAAPPRLAAAPHCMQQSRQLGSCDRCCS